MKVRIVLLTALTAVLSLTACEGLRDALTAHTGMVARAERQELTAQRLGEMIGASEAPVQREVVKALADIWVNYQLLGVAAARGDSLSDTAVVDSAMWAAIAGSKARQFYTRISEGWGRVDTATAPEAYERGDLFAAEHILLMTQNEPDSVRRTKAARIRAIRARVTPQNFSQLASELSEDQGSARQGGGLGVFPRGTMVREFEQAVATLPPGGISDPFETQFGYHIVRRPTFAEVREDFLEAMAGVASQRAESTYTVQMDSTSRIEIRRNAAARAKAAAMDMDEHRNDRTVIASSTAGQFTVARLVQWLETFPPNQPIAQRIATAPDSTIEQLVKNFVRNDIVVRAADSLGITVDTAEMNRIRTGFAAQIQQAWRQLRVHPSQLADSAASQQEREDLAARRIEAYVEAMLANRAPFIPIVSPVQAALRSRYDARVNSAGIDRALQIAQRQRAAAEATRQQTSPAVPLPESGPQTAPPAGPAQPQLPLSDPQAPPAGQTP